ncbi:MocR-like pyridoxine biosynthesis transcription factor PdxR [Hutsoniella sourekii]|uniref:MocR-like pyridoxine biosynthesis transcription factor PdxR n=1 Tax=Hutsoniella sourekii TaxID=87650 RepID=UPI0004AF89FA|nr:PLP-dependent aminotransferase family protein [Hutsoniella sourekii]
MELALNRHDKFPLYRQVYHLIKDQILSGQLVAGQKLPSKRQLAQINGISYNTVVSAYNQLMDEGYIYAQERRGYYVGDISQQVRPLQKQALASELEREDPEPLVDLTRSIPDPELYPFNQWAKIELGLLRNHQAGIIQPIEFRGLESLRQAIADYLAHSRSVACQARQIILAPSSSSLFAYLFRVLGQEAKRIAVEDPGYHPLIRRYEALGHHLVPLTLDANGIDSQQLSNLQADWLYTTPNHQFPTGAYLPMKRRQALIRWVQEQPDRYIIEDDYDSEFKYSGLPLPSLKSLDASDQVIYMGSLSRSLSPGLRVSYMVVPDRILPAFMSLYGREQSPINSLVQYSLRDFFVEGYFERHINRSRRFYKKKRDHLINLLLECDPHGQLQGEAAGLHLLWRPSRAFDSQALKSKLELAGYRLNTLADYCLQPKAGDDQFLFISFSSLSTDQMNHFVSHLSTCLGLAN